MGGRRRKAYRYPWLASVFSAGQGPRMSPGCGPRHSWPVTGHLSGDEDEEDAISLIVIKVTVGVGGSGKE